MNDKERYESIEIHFANGDVVTLKNPTLTMHAETRIAFEVENQRWWFNLNEVAYTILTYFNSKEEEK